MTDFIYIIIKIFYRNSVIKLNIIINLIIINNFILKNFILLLNLKPLNCYLSQIIIINLKEISSVNNNY